MSSVMSNITRYFRIPRPNRFLYFFGLSSGCEIALMTLIVNKLSGVFGVFGLLSGASISALQLSMYFYSLATFTVLCLLTPNIRKRVPFETIAFAFLYLIDSFINIAYTVAFGASWFAVLSDTYGADPKGDAPGVPPPVESAAAVMNATTQITPPATSPLADIEGRDTPGVMQPESATSIVIIAIAWTIRFYLLIVVFAHARDIVRKSAKPDEAPFEGNNDGEGWKGKLGRTLVRLPRSYWEGDGWMSYEKRRSTERSRFRSLRLGSLEV